jgi:hypothetical protein
MTSKKGKCNCNNNCNDNCNGKTGILRFAQNDD